MKKFDNTLIRFFWPKEMRQLVDQYRAEGCLNEEAVAHFTYQIKKRHLLFAVLAIILLVIGGPLAQLIGGLLLLFSPIFVKIDLYLFYKRQMSPYTNGKKLLAKSQGTIVGFGGLQRIDFIFGSGTQKGIIKLGSNPKLEKSDFFKKGESFHVYFDSQNNVAMPDIIYLKKLCSLTSKIMEKA